MMVDIVEFPSLILYLVRNEIIHERFSVKKENGKFAHDVYPICIRSRRSIVFYITSLYRHGSTELLHYQQIPHISKWAAEKQTEVIHLWISMANPSPR